MKIYFPNSSSINEWSEWHLTPAGWKQGAQKREDSNQLIEVEAPADRVATYRYHENIAINSTWLQKQTLEIWRNPNSKIVDELLEKFGGCPESLS